MNKDVIYIDIDDDVTAIISKIKKTSQKVVALVPPKRAGALQSAVNLRLLDRMAKADKKQLVLVTHNPALVALAANARIPVAKNLQSKPELADERIDTDENDTIIDGSAIPVGDFAGMSTDTPLRVSRNDVIDTVDISLPDETTTPEPMRDVSRTKKSATPSARKAPKIPNFDTFRKKLFFAITGGIGLVALLVWMFVFAPAATIIVTASTSPFPVSTTVTLGGSVATDYAAGVVRSVTQQQKQDVTVEFEATGQKNTGTKATGTVTFEAPLTASIGTTIDEGTIITRSGRSFATTESVTMTLSNFSGVDVGIVATEGGTASNGISGNASGAPSGIAATIVSTSGGTDKISRVVSAEDLERAKGVLQGKSTEDPKKALIALFTNGEKVIDNSFSAQYGESVSKPAVGEEATDGKAALVTPATYTIQAIERSELEVYVKALITASFAGDTSQKIFSSGVDEATVGNYRQQDQAQLATITTSASVGPVIEDAAVKEAAKGKIYGDVQSTLQSRTGIKEVDVKFSYFWVTRVPSDIEKITIEYKIDGE